MEVLERAQAQSWYHTLELPGLTTTGIFDLRPYVHLYGLPEDMSGMRALEIGTWDGFWAFEMERRGAEVVALDLDDEADLDWPPRRRPASFPDVKRGSGFQLAKEMFGSKVERVVRSVYDAVPDDLGQFDVTFCGSVLIHLRDQMLALERIANLTKPGGTFISAEEHEPLLDRIPLPLTRFRAEREAAVVFWMPNLRAWKAMMRAAGFESVDQHGHFKMDATDGYSVRHAVFHCRR